MKIWCAPSFGKMSWLQLHCTLITWHVPQCHAIFYLALFLFICQDLVLFHLNDQISNCVYLKTNMECTLTSYGKDMIAIKLSECQKVNLLIGKSDCLRVLLVSFWLEFIACLSCQFSTGYHRSDNYVLMIFASLWLSVAINFQCALFTSETHLLCYQCLCLYGVICIQELHMICVRYSRFDR